MEAETEKHGRNTGRFLEKRRSLWRRRIAGYLTVTVLLTWDGLLLYMIVRRLIEPVYGAAFVAVVSIYLGYQL